MVNNRLLIISLLSLIAAPVLAGCASDTGDQGDGGDGGTGGDTGDGGGTAPAIKTECDGATEATAQRVAGATTGAPASVSPLTTLWQHNAARPLAAAQQDAALKIGTLLPLTGSLEAFGGSMEAATDLAAKQINDAGGINGQPIELVHEDSRSDPTQAPNAFNNLVNEGVSGVVGGAASSVTAAILDLAIDNEIVVVSPASTSPTLTLERDNEGYFYRVPPSDALQGAVLANLVWDSGCQSAALLEVNNPYGVGLGTVFAETFQELGGTITQEVKFEESGTTFTSQVQQAGSGSPAAIVFIGYPTEGGQIVKEAYENGLLEDSVLFFSEGVKDPEFVELVGRTTDDEYILAGLSGTTPASGESPALAAFQQAYQAEHGEEPGLFAAESYDAVFAIALGALAAGENGGSAIKENIRDVYNKPGADVTGATVATGTAALTAGQDINYVGATGDFDWDENGDPADGIYSKWTVTADGTIEESSLDESEA